MKFIELSPIAIIKDHSLGNGVLRSKDLYDRINRGEMDELSKLFN
ncbi:hypothetical protein [Bacillus sp. S/N-304-OC-R1]|nr:hypothetical protein [Bacillus sp. S/N-304-OC-R1]